MHCRGFKRAFTLIELLVTLAIICLLAALLAGGITRALDSARRAVCMSNMHQMNTALSAYLMDSQGAFFPYQTTTSQGTLWYWGLETGGGAEGQRQLDMTRGYLADYIPPHTVQTCPSLNYGSSCFKLKFASGSYGYGLNAYMLTGTPNYNRSQIKNFFEIEQPAATLTWADSIQINTWQKPATPESPMFEEWYYLDGTAPPKYHFRHMKKLVAGFADGHVGCLPPTQLDPRCDGSCGYLESPGQDYYLQLAKTSCAPARQ